MYAMFDLHFVRLLLQSLQVGNVYDGQPARRRLHRKHGNAAIGLADAAEVVYSAALLTWVDSWWVKVDMIYSYMTYTFR
jgi:hypothetical protein